MRAVTKSGLAAVSLAAGVALAGCSSGSSSTADSSPALATSTGSTATAAAAAAATAQPTASSGSTCQPGNVTISLGPTLGSAQAPVPASDGNPSLGQGQYDQIVDLTNSGSAACTMDGFPGVNLEGTANGSSGYQWPLTRSTETYATVTLQPGDSAHFGIVYLPYDSSTSGQTINVATIIATPPNDFSSKQVSWSKTLLLQDEATHPGTWITPVSAGSGA